MENQAVGEARRWLTRQLAWEASLDRLVQRWEKQQGVREHPAGRTGRAVAKAQGTSGLPLEKPAA